MTRETHIMTGKIHKLSTTQTILAVLLSIGVLALSSGLSTLICLVPFYLAVYLTPMPEIILLLKSILYAGFTFIGIMAICMGLVRTRLSSLRITRPSIRPVWLLTAVLLPVFLVLAVCLCGGQWEMGPALTLILLPFCLIMLILHLTTGLVEEAVFRGVILGCLENRYNRPVAIGVSSVLFAVMHLFGHPLHVVSAIQILIAGTVAGILFSLITCESNSIWNSALVHGLWNFAVSGGILHIGTEATLGDNFNLILTGKSSLISGGDFGIGVSILSIFVYALFCVLALLLLIRRKRQSLSPIK